MLHLLIYFSVRAEHEHPLAVNRRMEEINSRHYMRLRRDGGGQEEVAPKWVVRMRRGGITQ